MALVACAAALVLCATATAATPSATTPVGTPPPTADAPPRLTEAAAVDALLEEPKVVRWLERYPPDPETDASFERRTREWTVHVWSGEAGEVARGGVADADGRVTEAWTGPQVAWRMARGRPGAFGGKLLTSWPVWLGLS
ncbi:MAG TPA: hypothetical protein VHH57_09300, partial [Gaiella sp.]|nr:hypothetical protein [Gaiella sp.]